MVQEGPEPYAAVDAIFQITMAWVYLQFAILVGSTTFLSLVLLRLGVLISMLPILERTYHHASQVCRPHGAQAELVSFHHRDYGFPAFRL